MKKSIKTKIIIICVLLVLIIGGVVAYFAIPRKEASNPTTPVQETVEGTKIDDDNPYQKIWESNHAISDDYVGEVYFDSGLINLPFVCPTKPVNEYSFYTYNGDVGNLVSDYENGCEGGVCSGNDVYLRMNWKNGEYDKGGSIFMDYRNSIYDQNIILYGHNYIESLDPTRTMFFTPLEFLMKQENYDANRYVNVVLDHEVRRYEIAYVYIFHLDSDYDGNLQYFRTNYNEDYYGNPDEGYYQKYIDKMEEVKLYDTGVKLTTSDNTLTLQTCVVNNPNEIEIVVCRQIG